MPTGRVQGSKAFGSGKHRSLSGHHTSIKRPSQRPVGHKGAAGENGEAGGEYGDVASFRKQAEFDEAGPGCGDDSSEKGIMNTGGSISDQSRTRCIADSEVKDDEFATSGRGHGKTNSKAGSVLLTTTGSRMC